MIAKKKLLLMLAAVMVAALFLVLPGKVYGDTNNESYHVNLVWDFDYVIVNEPGPAGQRYLVEYGEDGKPFYRYGDTEIAVEKSKVRSEHLSLSLDVDMGWVTTGHEFDERFGPVSSLGQEIAGWSTEPGGDINHLNYFHFLPEELFDGLTLYPILKPIPNVTYHNTITGEVFESPGGTGEYWEPTHEEPYPPEDFHPDYTLYAKTKYLQLHIVFLQAGLRNRVENSNTTLVTKSSIRNIWTSIPYGGSPGSVIFLLRSYIRRMTLNIFVSAANTGGS